MKTCNKCGVAKPLEAFHTEMRRGKRKHKARCATCVKAEWAQRRAALRGEVPMAQVLNAWRGPVTPNLGLRP